MDIMKKLPLLLVFIICTDYAMFGCSGHLDEDHHGPSKKGEPEAAPKPSAQHPDGIAVSDEKRLIKHLLDDYEMVGVVGRPVYNTSNTIRVEFGLALIQILDLDEKNQVLTTNCWSRYTWTDILLQWNPEEFGGVEEVRIPIDKVWTPDIVLYNYADDRLEEKRKAMAVVSKDGTVLYIPPAIFKSSCPINTEHFPFDYQRCDLKFGSWTYDGFKLDIGFFDNKDEVDLTDYIPSNEWDIMSHPAIKNTKYYPCCKEPYPDLTFTVVIKRKSAFYNYILILPCVLLSSLTLVVFWLPPESPAKMVLGMNIFVAFFVLLLLLADSTPPAARTIPLIGMNIFVAFFLLLLLLADVTPPAASNVPRIGAYYCLNMILITLSTFLSVIVINLYFRGDRKNRVPRWLKLVMVDFLACLMCLRNEMVPEDQKRLETVKTDGKTKDKKKIKCPELKYNKFQMSDVYRDGNHARNHAESTSPDKSPIHLSHSLESDVREIRRQIRTIMHRITDKEAQAKVNLEWRIVALVLDRLFFFIYLTTIIVSLATIFPRAQVIDDGMPTTTPGTS